MKAAFVGLMIVSCAWPGIVGAQSLMPNRVVETQTAQPIALGPTADMTIVMSDPNSNLLLAETEPAYEVTSMLETKINKAMSGVLEYRWREGKAPALAIAGLPAEVKFKKSTLMLGLNYEFE